MNLIQQLIQHSSAHAPSRVIGIDLGTTNCTVAQVKLPLDPGLSAEASCECLYLDTTDSDDDVGFL